MADLKNVSVVLHPEDKSFSLENTPIPVPKPNEVLLQIRWTGICGSDVHMWSWGRIGNFVVDRPAVLGHEASAVVLEVGSKVTNLKKGDRVAIEGSQPCYVCDLCVGGRYNLCPDLKSAGLPPLGGLFTRFFAFDAHFCFQLPDNVSDEEGAMVEPLAVALHACRRAKLSAGDTVLICGAGPIGLLVLLVAKAMGAGKVMVTDIREDRLQVAKTLGAHLTKVVGSRDERTTAQEIRDLLGEAPHVTLDCCGFETTLKTSIYATKSGGKTIVVGLGPGDTIPIPIVEAALKEVDIIGVFKYAHCYKRAIAMISSGAVNVKPLITHKFEMSEVAKAFQVAKEGTGAIKVMVKCHE